MSQHNGVDPKAAILAADSPMPAAPAPEFIVGVGASAGGLEALERLFERMPTETSMAFVVIQHLSPDFKSLTDELLARRTALPIRRVEDGMMVRPGVIYLLPPRKEMIISDGKLLLADKDPSLLLTLPIDHFFRSLAREAGERAVGIILSGTGSDGSRGIRDIYEAGGLVIAQTPESAKFDGMPKSALQTGAVNLSLVPEEMPDALARYAKHPLGDPDAKVRPVDAVPESAMEAIFRLLRNAHGIDFSYYKPETVTRRTERRLLLNQPLDLDQYVRQLETDTEELNCLYKDLLIGVTRFFRDRHAFDRLGAEVLAEVIGRLDPQEELRIWVAGCATGEEAYSLAILAQEAFDTAGKPVRVKVFATDAHRASLEVAGAGIYSEAALVDLSPERRNRYFIPKDGVFQVAADLRKLVVFAQHNVLKDAPFTRMDLISCRNLLIYFQPPSQKKVLSLFHFGLKAGGVLFLGPSESPGELGDEFDILDPRWKIYRKRRDVRLSAEVGLPTAVGTVARRPADASGAVLRPGSPDGYLLAAYDAMLNEFMPPSLLVNERRELIRSYNGASAYLRHKDGWFSADVLDIVDPELRIALTGALPRAFKEVRSVAYKGLRVGSPQGECTVNLTVKPLAAPRSDPQYAIICLEESGAAPPLAIEAQELDLGQASHEQFKNLEAELRFTKENLQATVEELETSNEELQATNEELVAANEELQSTNEELHSVNEELYTVNGEHQKKITELTELTADMDNLLASTEVHTLFLDRDLRIRKFTPKLAEVFNLLPQDAGRRMDSFTHCLDHPHLMEDVRGVLRSGTPCEKQVRDRMGNWFLLRILPYRAAAALGGAVLTLIDINGLKRAEAESRLKDRQLASILTTSPSFLFIKDMEGRYQLADDSFRRTFGVDPVGKTAREIYPPHVAETIIAQDRRVQNEGVSVETEVVLPLADGPHTFLAVRFPVRDESGRVVGVSGVKTDITALKHAESQARAAVAQRDQFLAMLSHELRNPLAAVRNATQLLESVGLAAPEAREWFQVIDRRARHMTRLLDDLLDVARITQGKIEVRKDSLDLNELVPGVLEEVRRPFAERQVKLLVEKSAGPLSVLGDSDRLEQIQVNLLLNAAKYTPEGGTVWYTLTREGTAAVVRVRDTGCGMDPVILDKVFDLFFQAQSTLDRMNGGIGVGLTLVRDLVSLHGGQVQAYSAGPGRGSEFVVTLPLACTLDATPEAAVPPLLPPSREGTCRILVIEDDPDIRNSMQVLLELEGHAVRTAEDGPAALAALDAGPVEIALVDLGLPGMTGFELAREIRRHRGPEQIRLVALTGYARDSDREQARAAGFDAHLAKPLRLAELSRILREVRSNSEPGQREHWPPPESGLPQ